MEKIDINEAVKAMNNGRFIDYEDAFILLARKVNEIIDKLNATKCSICHQEHDPAVHFRVGGAVKDLKELGGNPDAI